MSWRDGWRGGVSGRSRFEHFRLSDGQRTRCALRRHINWTTELCEQCWHHADYTDNDNDNGYDQHNRTEAATSLVASPKMNRANYDAAQENGKTQHQNHCIEV